MAGQEASQIEIPDAWVQQFKSRVATDCKGTAPSAWKKIEEAGLADDALLLLWGYAGGAYSEIAAMHKRTEYAIGRTKAAIRARNVAETKTPKRVGDGDLFQKRASESLHNALEAAWPMPTGSVRTVGEELALASEIKGREITLAAGQKSMVKAAGKRSSVNRFYILFLLRSYADVYGVKLGIKRLIALAWCADPDRSLDEGTLGRYLSTIPKSVRDAFRADTLPTLPPPRKTQL